jgi:hypothetical protein
MGIRGLILCAALVSVYLWRLWILGDVPVASPVHNITDSAAGMAEGMFAGQQVVARMNDLDVAIGITDDPATDPVTETFTAEP